MKKYIVYLAITAVAFALVTSANARLVEVFQVADPIQDEWVLPNQVHELGQMPPFPANQRIEAYDVLWNGHIPCLTDYLGGSVVQIRMQNLTGLAWNNVWYVADPETSFSNWDEFVGEVGFSPWRACKINNLGENTPLVFESFQADNIFQVGEVWEFVIQDYSNTLGLPASLFASLGIAGASAGDLASSGSIIVVPEPSAVVLIALGCLALLWRRRS